MLPRAPENLAPGRPHLWVLNRSYFSERNNCFAKPITGVSRVKNHTSESWKSLSVVALSAELQVSKCRKSLWTRLSRVFGMASQRIFRFTRRREECFNASLTVRGGGSKDGKLEPRGRYISTAPPDRRRGVYVPTDRRPVHEARNRQRVVRACVTAVAPHNRQRDLPTASK